MRMYQSGHASLRALLSTVFIGLSLAGSVLAHHGWRWTEEGNVEVTGVIVSATLGNPHGVLVLDVNGEQWTAEIGQPWRNERAGLSDSLLEEGVEITIDGQRSADPGEYRVKAERVMINGQEFVLYPDRL